MSQQLFEATQNILKMPYFKNDHATSGNDENGHELAILEVLKRSGFKEVPVTDYPNLTQKILKEWVETSDATTLEQVLASMPEGSCILQPGGTQCPPDTLVKDFGGRIVAYEAKSSSKGYTPMWNDSVPSPNVIYVFSSGKLNETTIFLGKDVIDEKMYKVLMESKRRHDAITEELKPAMMEADTFNRGWIQKVRPQHFQMGTKDKTNFFTHTSRANCEKNALDFAKQ